MKHEQDSASAQQPVSSWTALQAFDEDETELNSNDVGATRNRVFATVSTTRGHGLKLGHD